MEEAKWERENSLEVCLTKYNFHIQSWQQLNRFFLKKVEKTQLIILCEASKSDSYLMNVNIWGSPWTSWKDTRVNLSNLTKSLVSNLLIKFYMNMLHVCIICILLACSLRHIGYGNFTLESTTLMQICHFKVVLLSQRAYLHTQDRNMHPPTITISCCDSSSRQFWVSLLTHSPPLGYPSLLHWYHESDLARLTRSID